jgi:hypothetical protein
VSVRGEAIMLTRGREGRERESGRKGDRKREWEGGGEEEGGREGRMERVGGGGGGEREVGTNADRYAEIAFEALFELGEQRIST